MKYTFRDHSHVEAVSSAEMRILLQRNHDVGNQPTKESIEKYTDNFGDDYFSFWFQVGKYIFTKPTWILITKNEVYNNFGGLEMLMFCR